MFLYKLLIYVLIVSAVSNSLFTSGQTPQSGGGQIVVEGTKGRKIDELMQAYDREGLLSGTILVAEKGNVIYKRGFGYANVEFRVPNEPNTKFRLASVSKAIVAILVMKLVDQGKISLDGKLSDYLPGFRKDADKITVRHLLSHTSGLAGGIGDFTRREMRDPVSRDALLKTAAENPLDFEPGTRVRYGLAGFAVLSMIVEKVTGKTYEQALRENVLEPLGMRDTGIEDAAASVARTSGGRIILNNPQPVIERFATGYVKTRNGYLRAPYMDISTGGAGASVYSTVEDLFLLDHALSGDKLLSAQAKEQMFKPVLEDKSLGWDVRNLALSDLSRAVLPVLPGDAIRNEPADFRLIMKGGDVWGYTSFWARVPEKQQSVIILLNGAGIVFNTDVTRMTHGILSILNDQPYLTPRENLFVQIIRQKGFEEALKTFRQLKEKEPQNPIINEKTFNEIGYEYLNNKNYAPAIDILRLNAEAFPDSANAYDSLAEAYETSGNRETAIKFYEKVLEALPRDGSINEQFKNRLKENALKKIQELKIK
jgi:CubicO group peptidase (beta-lactamase class C family)